jgi:hypothetical protein
MAVTQDVKVAMQPALAYTPNTLLKMSAFPIVMPSWPEDMEIEMLSDVEISAAEEEEEEKEVVVSLVCIPSLKLHH